MSDFKFRFRGRNQTPSRSRIRVSGQLQVQVHVHSDGTGPTTLPPVHRRIAPHWTRTTATRRQWGATQQHGIRASTLPKLRVLNSQIIGSLKSNHLVLPLAVRTAEDALRVDVMNLGPGGKRPCLRDGVNPRTGSWQVMQDANGIPKGMRRILEERGLW